ncbi:MAG: aminoacyl--tRNA ligase-related protein, partial [Ilumatobacteraceae bacterium]
MIDLRVLRSEPDTVRELMARRNKPELGALLDQALVFDGRMREISTERDAIRQQVNELSKQVGSLRRSGEDAQAETLSQQSRALGDDEQRLASETDTVAQQLRDVLLRLPNIPHPDAVIGTSDAENPVITGPVNVPDTFADHQRVPHWDTAEDLGILDNERAVKISGAMFTMQRGAGATMARALCQYALDQNADAFEEIRPPSLVSTATLTATGQLPKFADDAYSMSKDDLWCIPTAEAPLTSIHAGEVLAESELPIRYMAHSSCYRREAGSAGRDTRGMLRSHEFDKVEIFS